MCKHAHSTAFFHKDFKMIVELLALTQPERHEGEEVLHPGDTNPRTPLREHGGRGQQEREGGWAWSRRSREVLKQKIKWSMLTLNNGSG